MKDNNWWIVLEKTIDERGGRVEHAFDVKHTERLKSTETENDEIDTNMKRDNLSENRALIDLDVSWLSIV